MIENGHSSQEGDLMLIWKMKAPPLIKNILWRACRGCLLTCGQLHQRGIPCPIICTMCGTQVVNSWHLFFDCATSVECWQEQGLWEQISTIMSQASSFKDVCFKALSQFDSVLRAVFATTFWAIWRRRNDLYWMIRAAQVRQCRPMTLGLIGSMNPSLWKRDPQGREDLQPG